MASYATICGASAEGRRRPKAYANFIPRNLLVWASRDANAGLLSVFDTDEAESA
ncbi:hypothetical protein GX51_07999 [Blastomyces parvus]|uniref:Uncharacterized protein n=1 Tax=Blastomyces parvus TaxID=2060905 RepID=A0A2B7WHM1_9EURO|nr:hypothetical protein GX51_07999 [Blastomyces parvus]